MSSLLVRVRVHPTTISDTTLPSSSKKAILAIIQRIDAAAALVCNVIDKALELEHERPALKDLRKGVKRLKSGAVAFNVLLSAMWELSGSTLARQALYVIVVALNSYAQRIDNSQHHRLMEKMERIQNLARALKATQLLLEGVPDGNKKFGRALKFVLRVLNADIRPRDFTGDLKEATHEIFVCRQNNERAFKLIWYHYVVSEHRVNRIFDIGGQGSTDDRLWWTLQCVLDAFYVYPFALSPERIHPGNLYIFAIINQSREAAIRHEALARRLGEAWVDSHVLGYAGRIRGIGILQTSLFELLWSGTVEQLKGDSPYSSDDPERPEFERTLEELERVLQETIVSSKRQHFSIAFCGMVKAGKSLLLNALMGRSILPSDGESYDPRTLYYILSITAELPSAALPCRLRHVEGHRVPKLQFQAQPFLVALEKLRYHRYGQKMQTYQPPPENMFEAPLSDAPSEPSEDEILLMTIYSQWADLHAATRINLLKFESPGFRLPLVATGDLAVKILVSSYPARQLCVQLNAISARSTERYRPIVSTIRSEL